jgi:hypothetical protein
VLVCLIPSDDPAIEFLPHLLSRNLPSPISAEQLRELLGAEFQCQVVGAEPTASEDAAELARINSEQPCLAMGTSDGIWIIVSDAEPVVVSPDELLIDRINRKINRATSTNELLVSHSLTASVGVLAKSSLALFQSNPSSLQFIEPARTSDELLKLSDAGVCLPEFGARLHPGVPTGLAFLSTENPGPPVPGKK